MKKEDWRLKKENWCQICDNFHSRECNNCKPPYIREGYEGKRASKYSVVPPSEWEDPGL